MILLCKDFFVNSQAVIHEVFISALHKIIFSAVPDLLKMFHPTMLITC